MDDLPLVAILFELPGDDALLALGKVPLRPAGIVEIDEADRVAVRVRSEDARRTAPRAVLATVDRRQFEDDIAAEQHGARRPSANAFDSAGGEMVEDIDYPGEVEPL